MVFKLGTPCPFNGLQLEGERGIGMHYSHRTAAAAGGQRVVQFPPSSG